MIIFVSAIIIILFFVLIFNNKNDPENIIQTVQLEKKFENDGFIVNDVPFEYCFSFPLFFKNKDSFTKILKDAFVSRHLTVAFKNDSYFIKLAGAVIGSVPEEFIKKFEAVYKFQLYIVIEQMPTSELECIVSVNVSKNPRPKPKSYLDNQYEVKGVFVKSRMDHLDDYCSEGDDIYFKDEYSNKYDNEAIQIICMKKLIGYVAKVDQAKINKLRLKDLQSKIYRKYYTGTYLNVYYKFYQK